MEVSIMKVKCIKDNFGTPKYADIEIGKEYQVYDIRQNIINKEYLIKDASHKKKWYEEKLFMEVI
jgi:hypothetical protein